MCIMFLKTELECIPTYVDVGLRLVVNHNTNLFRCVCVFETITNVLSWSMYIVFYS